MPNGVISYFITFVSFVFFGAPVAAPVAEQAVNTPQSEAILTQDASSTTISPDTLATCLTDRGAKFYGAYWCGHCADEKELFGEAFKKVNYVECTADGPNGDTQACIDAGIEGYPTWQMPGKADQVGTQSLESLATWSGCTRSLE